MNIEEMNVMKKSIKQLFFVTLACVSMLMLSSRLAWAATDSNTSSSSASNGNTQNDTLSREAMISQLLNDAKKNDTSQQAKNKTQKDSQQMLPRSQTFTSLQNMNNAVFTGNASDRQNKNDEESSMPSQTYDKMQNQAFSSMTRSMMPLSPDQIKQLHGMYNESRRAASSHAGTPPKPTSSSIVPDLSPGSTPPVIRLLEGYITSLVFLDSTGESWPIVAVDVGDPRSFSVQWDHKGNTLLIQALSAYKAANLAVIVKGLTTPVMLTLLPGQTAVDYRVDIRIPRLGPNANTSMINHLPSTSNIQLL